MFPWFSKYCLPLGVLWKEWCWSWNSTTLATSCEELTQWKRPDAGRDWGQEQKGTTEDEMAGWHHRLNGHEFEWTPGAGDGQGGLACCDSWGHRVRHYWATELNWRICQFSSRLSILWEYTCLYYMILCIPVVSIVTYPFSVLILLIWPLFLFLMGLTKSLPVLSTFSKDQLLILLTFNLKKKVHESLLCQLLECQSSKTLIVLGSKGKAETQHS